MGDTYQASPRDAEILKEYQTGMTMAELGAKHGITRQRISQIFKRAGVVVAPSRRGRKPVDAALSQAYVAEAVKLGNKVQAAQKFGVSPDTIGRALRRAGISLRVGKFTDARVKADIVSRYESGERLREIAESYGTRAQHVNSLLRKWGVEAKRAALWKRQG